MKSLLRWQTPPVYSEDVYSNLVSDLQKKFFQTSQERKAWLAEKLETDIKGYDRPFRIPIVDPSASKLSGVVGGIWRNKWLACLPALRILNLTPNRHNDVLCSLAPGPYTWVIFFSPKSVPPTFYMAIVPNPFPLLSEDLSEVASEELVGRHPLIVEAIKQKFTNAVAFLAGEAFISQERKTVWFNLQSGSIMLPIIKNSLRARQIRPNREAVAKEQKRFWIPLSEMFWRIAASQCKGITAVFSPETLLDKDERKNMNGILLKEYFCGPPSCQPRLLKTIDYDSFRQKLKFRDRSGFAPEEDFCKEDFFSG